MMEKSEGIKSGGKKVYITSNGKSGYAVSLKQSKIPPTGMV